MYEIDLTTPSHVHFVGIGGISMSGLAQILLKRGHRVTGSDVRRSDTVMRLENLGAHVAIGQSADNIQPGMDLVVYTAAVKTDNPEIAAAIKRDIPIVTRAQLLGKVMADYSHSVAVAGTHGKTTATSMVAHVLSAADVDPTVSVGGILPLIDGNIRVGDSPYFVTEACEYHNSFHQFFPLVGLVLNVEEDHMDFFEDIHAIRQSFKTFHQNIPASGTLVLQGDIEDLDAMTQGIPADVVTYSVSGDCDYGAVDVSFNILGHGRFTATYKGKAIGDFKLSVPGLHNISNALGVIAAMRALDVPMPAINQGLEAFTGTHRRFQYKGDLGGVHVVDDYAHHPTEIRATILGARNMAIKGLTVVFQPHTFTRTKAFLHDFADALAMADNVILMDIYSASREEDPGDIHATDIQKLIQAKGTNCDYFETMDAITYHIFTHCKPGDLLITMGAGDVYLVGESLFQG